MCLRLSPWRQLEKDRDEQRGGGGVSADHMPPCRRSISPDALPSRQQWVNLVPHVLSKPAWKTSACSVRHLLLTGSVQHGKETHAHAAWGSAMSALSRTQPDCGAKSGRELLLWPLRGGNLYRHRAVPAAAIFTIICSHEKKTRIKQSFTYKH